MEEGGSGISSFFSGNKRIPQLSFWGYLFGAAVADILLCDWCPGAGTAFVMFCRGMYMLNGYKTDKMTTTTAVNAIAGFIPIVADFTSIIFVVTSYNINHVETKPAEGEKRQSRTQQLISFGTSYATAGATAASLKGLGAAKGASEIGGSAAYEGTRGNPADANKTTAYKNTEHEQQKDSAYQKDKSVDGITRPAGPRYVPRQPVFRQKPSNDNETYAEHAA